MSAGRLFVPGHPITQGSKDYKGKNARGKAILVESADGLAEWRQRIAWAGHGHGWRPYDGPCSVDLEFVLRRPVSTPKRRTPPAIRKPDVDKLLRAVLDALTGVAWTDDARVIDARSRKRLAELGETPGVWIAITAADTPVREPQAGEWDWLHTIVGGIDRTECDDDAGWWPTSTGAAFGARVLDELKAAITARYSTEEGPN